MSATRRRGAGFWAGVSVGGPITAFGVRGLLDAAPATRPVQSGFGVVGLAVVHDAVVAPLACVIGLLLVARLPEALRGPVRAGLIASATSLLVAWPALRGSGRARVPDNPSVQPLDYGTAIATVLAVTWVLVAGWVLVRWWRSRITPG